MCISVLVICTAVLYNKEEVKDITLESLQTTSDLPLQPADAIVNADVIWLHKGKTPYEAMIVFSRKGVSSESDQTKGAQKDQQAREILSISPAKTVDTVCSEARGRQFRARERYMHVLHMYMYFEPDYISFCVTVLDSIPTIKCQKLSHTKPSFTSTPRSSRLNTSLTPKSSRQDDHGEDSQNCKANFTTAD